MTNHTDDGAAALRAYDFAQLGEKLADSLVRAAEEQVQRAQAILDQTKSMAEIIRNQVAAQANQIEDMTARFKAFGEQMLDAHRKLNGDDNAIAPADMVKLRAVADGVERDLVAPNRSTAPATVPRPDLAASSQRIARLAKNSDGHDELRSQVPAGEPHAPWVNRGGDHDRDTRGTGTSSNGER